MKRIVSLITAVVLLSGCRTFTRPIEWPVFEQHAQHRMNVFSSIPSRRMVIVKKMKGNGKGIEDDEVEDIVICAEASADVTDDLTSTMAASLAASRENVASATAAISSTLATSAKFLFKRTQGIQLYRDAMYHLCQARMNGFITKAEYREKASILFDKSFGLIEKELGIVDQDSSNKPGPSK